jgi:hypothetical protein
MMRFAGWFVLRLIFAWVATLLLLLMLLSRTVGMLSCCRWMIALVRAHVCVCCVYVVSA